MEQKDYERKSKTLKVSCSFPGCKAPPMTEQNLKRHAISQHGKCVPPKGQSTVVSLFTKQAAGGVKRDGDGQEVNPNGQSDVFAEDVEVDDDEEADLNKNVKDLTASKDDSIDVKMKKLAIDLEQTCQRVGADTERILKAAVESSIKENVEIAVKAALSDKKQEEQKLTVQLKAKTSKDLMREARSIRDITNRFPEFEHHPDETGKEVHCLVCSTHFSYSPDEPTEFPADEKLSEKFRNLKKHLFDHLKLSSHCRNIEKVGAQSAVWVKEEKRNKKVGLTLTRIVYHLVKKGRPDTDFTDQVYLAASGGADCGDINHSFNFVRTMLPYLAAAVKGRLVKMFVSKLESTGCLPPVNLNADKATHQRWSRHFIGGITVNPGTMQLEIRLF